MKAFLSFQQDRTAAQRQAVFAFRQGLTLRHRSLLRADFHLANHYFIALGQRLLIVDLVPIDDRAMLASHILGIVPICCLVKSDPQMLTRSTVRGLERRCHLSKQYPRLEMTNRSWSMSK